MAQLKVLYFDDLKEEREQFETLWGDILGLAGFDADILYEGELKNLEPKLERRPHVVIVDNSIEGTDYKGDPRSDPNEGAKFIASHKPGLPDTVFVLYTGKEFSMLQLGRRIPNPDLIATKDYLQNANYQQFLAGELRRLVRRTPLENVLENGGTDGGDARKRHVHSLIEQIVHDIRADGDGPLWDTAKLTRITGGFSGAVVCRLELEGAEDGAPIPTIVKIGPIDQIRREQQAFTRYAKWFLPHDLRVDIVGKGETGEWAAICYAFALGGQDDVETLADVLPRGRKKAIQATIRLLFNSKRQGWYKVASAKQDHLRDYLSNLPEYPSDKDEWRDISFEKSVAEICATEGIAFSKHESRLRIGDHEIDEIRRALRRLPNIKVPRCICHGDLNANNIFVTPSNNAIALIDFEQTGLHHVFRDFVSFESSVRSLFAQTTMAPPRLGLGELIDLELALLADVEADMRADPILEQVQSIRQAAFERFPSADTALYKGAVALHLWKLCGFRDDDKSQWTSEGERHLVSGLVSVLATMR